MGPAAALGALIWVAIIAYAGVQSGLAEIQHHCLSVLGALKGDAPDPSCAGAAAPARSRRPGPTSDVPMCSEVRRANPASTVPA